MSDTFERINILLVEDSEGDIRLVREALKEGKIINTIDVARDGVEAMEYLLRKGKYIDALRTELILLDLNLPKMDGREVLAEVKENENLKRIPIVVLTTSSTETDIVKTYDLHANCYIVKPLDLQRFIDVVKSIQTFWLTIVKLPDGAR